MVRITSVLANSTWWIWLGVKSNLKQERLWVLVNAGISSSTPPRSHCIHGMIFSGGTFKGSHQDQSFPVCSGKCYLCIGRWQEFTYTIQRLQTDQTASRWLFSSSFHLHVHFIFNMLHVHCSFLQILWEEMLKQWWLPTLVLQIGTLKKQWPPWGISVLHGLRITKEWPSLWFLCLH